MSKSAFALLCAAAALHAQDYALGPDWQPQPGVPKGAITKYTLPPGKFYPGTPDQAMLLVGDGQLKLSWSFQIAPDGSLANGEPYDRVDMPESTPASEVAGVTVDAGGQVYFAHALGIQVCEANGRCAQILAKPEPGQLTSLAFGGKNLNWLYVTEGGKLFRRPVQRGGVGAGEAAKTRTLAMDSNREIAISGDDLTEERLRALESERDLEQLTIWGGPITNEILEPLSRLTWLKGLVLGAMPIDDGAFRYLKLLRQVEYLNLAYTNIGGDFSALEGLPLRDVRLEGCGRIADSCTASLVRFPTLRQLEIHITPLTDRGLRHLGNSSLEILWLGPRITDEGMKTLPTITGLRHLDICAPGVTDRGVRELAELRNLEVLWLAETRTTDASVEVLIQLRGLRELALGHTQVTELGKARLRQALPQCRLVEG